MSTLYPQPIKNYSYRKRLSKPVNYPENTCHENIIKNENQILGYLKTRSYGDIVKLMPEIYKYLDSDEDDGIEYDGSELVTITYSDLYNFILGFASVQKIITKSKISELILDKLFNYAMVKFDIDMMREIIDITDGIDMFNLRINRYYINSVFRNDELFSLIFNNMTLTEDTINTLSFTVMYKINFLKIFLEKGYTLNVNYIASTIGDAKIDIIEMLIAYGHIEDVKLAFNSCEFHGYNTKFEWPNFIKMITLLSVYDINIDDKLDKILLFGVRNKMIEMVMFCLEKNSDLKLNDAIKMACEYDNNDALTYLIKMGGNIDCIIDEDIYDVSIATIKCLIGHNYNVSLNILNEMLYDELSGNNLDNIKYLIASGAELDSIFEKEHDEKNFKKRYDKYDDESWVSSSLEIIVVYGRIHLLKFLIENCYDLMILEMDRLFVISSANGQIDIMKYILGLGVNYDVFENEAFVMACMMGHLESVKLLLNIGLDVDNVKWDLFKIVVEGCGCATGYVSNIYDDVVKNSKSFMNDTYWYGDKHLDILKLLLAYNIPIPNEDIFGLYLNHILDVDVMTYLIDKGYNLEMETKHKTYYWQETYAKPTSLLESCIYMNMTNVVEILLEAGVNVFVNDNNVFKIIRGEHNDEMIRLFNNKGFNEYLEQI